MSLGDDIVDRLDRQRASDSPLEYSEAWRRRDWSGTAGHLAVLIADDEIPWVGRVQGGKNITNRDRIVRVSEVQPVGPIELGQFRDYLPARHRDVLSRRGIVPPGAGLAIVNALREIFPQDADVIGRLSRAEPYVLPPGPRGELLNQERDAVGLLLDIGTGDQTSRATLRSWSTPPAGAPFLAGMAGYAAIEDALIQHDVDRFDSWLREPSDRVEWRVFSSGSRRIFIMNANRTSVEQTLGVDVVYFNEARDSFVLVQYKKMRREQSGPEDRGGLFYRRDGNLDDELVRMRRIDELCAAQPGEFRLLPTASWLKLCDPTPIVDADPASLIKGMYLAREHFEELLRTSLGARGGSRLGYDNVPRHLNNTIFTTLVRDGWIGSRGPATEEIGRLVRESLEKRHSVVVGVQADAPTHGPTA
jgi:hypothetical protein